MATETRAQGRPPRGDMEVGRSRLLDRTRDALKSKPKIDIQRREIAIFAGVTPALVSYYYPDKWDLFAAAARPVILDYIFRMQGVLRESTPPRSKFRSVVNLFIDFNHHQGYLLDFYLENTEKMARQEDVKGLHEIYGEMLIFFESLVRDGLVRGRNAAFIQTSLWGWCKHVARQDHLAPFADTPDKDRILEEMAETVCDMFLNGDATQQAARDVNVGAPPQHAFADA